MKESEIRDSCYHYLVGRGVFCWRDDQGHSRSIRFGMSKYKAGVADILGIYRGVPLAIEIKTGDGKLSEKQIEFLRQFRKEGGVAFVARSVEDVIDHLGMADKERHACKCKNVAA